MARILFFVFLALLVWLAVRVVGTRRSRDDAAPPAGAGPSIASERILQCAWCGVHVPTSSALALPDGRVYCGAAHRDAAQSASAGSDPS